MVTADGSVVVVVVTCGGSVVVTTVAGDRMSLFDDTDANTPGTDAHNPATATTVAVMSFRRT